jgi:hypothetical protein
MSSPRFGKRVITHTQPSKSGAAMMRKIVQRATRDRSQDGHGLLVADTFERDTRRSAGKKGV